MHKLKSLQCLMEMYHGGDVNTKENLFGESLKFDVTQSL